MKLHLVVICLFVFNYASQGICQNCDCNEIPSLISMEDNLGIYEIPCNLPDTLSFYSESTGIQRRYIFLDCRGSILYQKQSRNGVLLVEGQFIPTDSIVKIGTQSLFGGEDDFGVKDTVTSEDAFYARKIGLWIYR